MRLGVKTDIYVKVQELGTTLRMTIGNMLVLSQGAFSALTLNAKKPLPQGPSGERLHESALRD